MLQTFDLESEIMYVLDYRNWDSGSIHYIRQVFDDILTKSLRSFITWIIIRIQPAQMNMDPY